MSRSGMPRVSVLLPVRNGGRYFAGALTSVLNQSLPDVEVIVVDDGSGDGSGELARRVGDPRITVLETKGVGVAGALNAGLAVARGALIARQDADDLSSHDRFEVMAAEFDRDRDLTVVTSRTRFIDGEGNDVRNAWTEAVRSKWESAVTHADFSKLLPQTCCIVHGSVMVRKAALDACGGYDTSLAVAQDYDLWLRLLPKHRFARVADELYTFRIHDAQMSATRSAEQARQAIAAKLRYLADTTELPADATARIIGNSGGDVLYREALTGTGWSEVGGDADVTIFTNFATLDRDIHDIVAGSPFPLARVGNFLVSTSWMR